MISDELMMIWESATCDERFSEEFVARNRSKSLWYTVRKTHSLEAPGRLPGRSGRLQGGSGEVPGGSRRLPGGSREAPGRLRGGSGRLGESSDSSGVAQGRSRESLGDRLGCVLGGQEGVFGASWGHLGGI